MEELLQAQLNAQRAGVSYAVVTIAEASGSVPRTSGKMLVYADGHSLGTIGGGPAERRAKADALAQLDAGQNAFLHYDFPTPGGASCAGRLSILIEVFQPKPRSTGRFSMRTRKSSAARAAPFRRFLPRRQKRASAVWNPRCLPISANSPALSLQPAAAASRDPKTIRAFIRTGASSG